MFKPPLVTKGKHGDWSIEPFCVSESEAEHFNAMSRIRREGNHIVPGRYIRLIERGTVWMSNTPDEYMDHEGFIRAASGRVLLIGLGLGLVAREVLDKKNVDHVTVVEKELSVIGLVGMKFITSKEYRDKISIVHADLWEWWPKKEVYGKFDCAWVDVWPEYNEDMLVEFKRARHHLNAVCMGQKVGCWKEKELKSNGRYR